MDIREEIRIEGRIEGRQEGQQEGLQKGLQKGRQEEERQAVVRNMLKERVDLAFISKVTGLPVREIKKLKNGF